MSSPNSFTRKLSLPLLFAFFAILIAMSPLFAQEAFAGWFVGDDNQKCYVDEGKCKTENPIKGCHPAGTLEGQSCSEEFMAQAPVETAKDIIDKGGSWLFDVTVGFVLKFLNYLLYAISTVLERLVALSAFLLEMAIDVSSAPFSDITILKDGWKIVRDVMNSFFVLFLFIIAIATILQLESYAWKQLLPVFIIVALLVNFSFVLTGVVIDFSNILGRTFFDKMQPISDNIAKAFDINNINNIRLANCTAPASSTSGIAGTISKYSKEWWCTPANAAGNLAIAWGEVWKIPTSETGELTKILFLLVLRVIMLFLMIFPILAGAALMIMRTVMLMVLIIFAPAAFTAYILPATRNYATQWWTELFSKSFFFPMYLFLLYIAINYGIKIGEAIKKTGEVGGTFSNLATIFNFLTMVAFMFIALSVARKSGIVGAETVMKYADASRKWATGYAGRRTGIPRLSEKLAESGAAQRFAARFPTLGGATLRTLQKGATLGGREAALKKQVDTTMGLAPRYQATAYLKAGAPARKRLEGQLKTEGMAEMMHFTDDQKTRDKIRDTAFASLPAEQRKDSQEKLKTAYGDREANRQSTGQVVGRFDSKYYTEDEEKKIFDEMKPDRRAKVLMRSTRDIAELEKKMIEGIGERDVREIERTYEELARTSIDLNPDVFVQKFNQLSEMANKKLFDIINPRELEQKMAGFADAGILASTPTTLTPAEIERLAPAERAQYEQKKFLNAMHGLGRNRNNIEIRKIAGAVRPKFYSELDYGTQEELARALTPAEAASMNEEDMKDATISQYFDGGQLEAIARSQRVSPETRHHVRDNVVAYSNSQRTLFGNQLYMTTITQAEYDRQIGRLDRLEAYLNRSSAYQ